MSRLCRSKHLNAFHIKLNSSDQENIISQSGSQAWGFKLDRSCAILGGAIPVGIILGTTAFELVIGLIGILWVVRQVLTGTKLFAGSLKNPMILPWIALLVSVYISAIANYRGIHGLAENFLFFRYPLCVLALIEIAQRLPLHRYLLKGLTIGIVLAIVNTIMAHVAGFDMIGRPLARYTGKLKEAARFSGLAAFAGPFFLAWGLDENRLGRLQRILLIGLGLSSLILVLQFDIRTAELAVMAGCFAALLLYVVRRFSWGWALMIAVLIISAAVFYFVVNKPYLGSFYDRIHIWKVAWAIWLENPIVGVSITGYRDAYREMITSGPLSRFAYTTPDGSVYDGMVDGTIEFTSHAHSLVFMLLSATGLLGLSAFGWLLVTIIVRLIKSFSDWRSGLIAWGIAFLVIGIAGYNIFDAWYTTLFVFFTVILAVMIRKIV